MQKHVTFGLRGANDLENFANKLSPKRLSAPSAACSVELQIWLHSAIYDACFLLFTCLYIDSNALTFLSKTLKLNDMPNLTYILQGLCME